MTNRITMADVGDFCVGSGNAVFQGGVGFLAGHALNKVDLWMHPVKNILGKTPIPIINPIQSAICAFAFAISDFAVKQIFDNWLGSYSQKPLCQVIRMAVSLSFAALVTSGCLQISFTLAAGAIAASIAGTIILTGFATGYTSLMYTPNPVPVKL